MPGTFDIPSLHRTLASRCFVYQGPSWWTNWLKLMLDTEDFKKLFYVLFLFGTKSVRLLPSFYNVIKIANLIELFL